MLFAWSVLAIVLISITTNFHWSSSNQQTLNSRQNNLIKQQKKSKNNPNQEGANFLQFGFLESWGISLRGRASCFKRPDGDLFQIYHVKHTEPRHHHG